MMGYNTNNRNTRIPRITFLYSAYSKLMWMCHHGETEVGGYGVLDASMKDGLLLVTDFRLVKQQSSGGTMEFDDEGLAEYLDKCSQEEGYTPERFMRLWIHTHPGDSADPSGVDEKTFSEKFNYPWSIMMIVSRKTPYPEIYARIKFTAGPGTEVIIPAENIRIRYKDDTPLDIAAWTAEYNECVHEKKWNTTYGAAARSYVYNGPSPKPENGTVTTNTGTTTNDRPRLALPGWDPDAAIPDTIGTPGLHPVVWYDYRGPSFDKRDFRKDLVNDKTHWRDYTKFIPESDGVLFYRGPISKTVYAYPIGEAGTDKVWPGETQVLAWLQWMWAECPYDRPKFVSEAKYSNEVYHLRLAIESGRFACGRQFKGPVQEVRGDSTPGKVAAAASNDPGVRSDRPSGS